MDDDFMFAHYQSSMMVIEDDEPQGFVMVGHGPDGMPLYAQLEPVKQHYMGFFPPEYLSGIRDTQIAAQEQAIAEAEEAAAAKREARRAARAASREAKAKAQRTAASKAKREARRAARQSADIATNTPQPTAGIDPLKVKPPRAKQRKTKN